MDLVVVRELFDRTLRADRPPADGVERTWFDGVLRTTQGAVDGIGWWDFGPDRTAAIVAREAARVRSVGGELWWPVYGHDFPEGLDRELADAGFEDLFGLETFLAVRGLSRREAGAAAGRGRAPGEHRARAGRLRRRAAQGVRRGRLDHRRFLPAAPARSDPGAARGLRRRRACGDRSAGDAEGKPPSGRSAMAASSRGTEGRASTGPSSPIAPPKPSGGTRATSMSTPGRRAGRFWSGSASSR